jgi:hypothetical protein
MSKIGKRIMKLITNELVFGDVEVITNNSGQGEFLIRSPYTAISGDIMPYCHLDLGSAPGAVQIHPMNVVWQAPLDEFVELNKVYLQATTGIVTDTKPKIVI